MAIKIKKTLRNLVALLAMSTNIGLSGEISRPYAETTFTSKYSTPQGIFADDASLQSYVSTDLTRNLTIGIWNNYSFKENAVNEIDYIISGRKKLNSRLTAQVDFQYWSYPTGTFGSFDSAEIMSVKDSGGLGIRYTHLNKDKDTKSGDRLQINYVKELNVGCGFNIAPSIETCLVENYYGLSGWSQITPGISLKFSRGGINASATLKQQIGLKEKIESSPYFTVSVGCRF